MKTSFSKFIVEGVSGYSITHVEDLDVETFIRSIERLHHLEVVQKLDGANLRAGLDDQGKFYTSREQKGGKRFYEVSAYPKKPSYDGFKTAHVVLQKIQSSIEEILSPGEAFSLEVIFGEQPNTVFYGKDGLNYIAFLEMVEGDDPARELDQSKIKELVEAAGDKTYTVKTEMSDTADGETVVRAPRLTDWKFTASDPVPDDHVKGLDFSEEIEKLKKWLHTENKKAENMGKDLTNFEVLKDKSRDLADERKEIQDHIMKKYKLPIKKKMIKMVNKLKPSIRGEAGDENAYHGIEGIIFTDPKTREKFKVVDREVFTKINQFNYQVRNTVAGKITSSSEDMPIETRGGIVGEARLRAIKLLGLEDAELPSQALKVLAKFKGETKTDTINNIVKSLHQLNFQSARKKIQAIYVHALADLEDDLNSFKKSADDYELELEDGKKIKYTPEIKRRTLMAFAEARQNLFDFLKDMRKCDDMYELIDFLFGAQIKKMQGRQPKTTEPVAEALSTSPARLKEKLMTELEDLGFTLEDENESPGTLKVWMQSPDNGRRVKLEDIGKKLSFKPTFDSKHGEETLNGQGFEITLQVPGDQREEDYGIVLVVYRRTVAGDNYKRGMDT